VGKWCAKLSLIVRGRFIQTSIILAIKARTYISKLRKVLQPTGGHKPSTHIQANLKNMSGENDMEFSFTASVNGRKKCSFIY
jgi:hypothetical protein